jgi:hypothetical protein
MIDLSRRPLRIVANCRAAFKKFAANWRVVLQGNTGASTLKNSGTLRPPRRGNQKTRGFCMHTAVFTVQLHRWPVARQTFDLAFLFMGQEAKTRRIQRHFPDSFCDFDLFWG